MAVRHQSVRLHNIVAADDEYLVNLREQPDDLSLTKIAARVIDALAATKDGVSE